MIGEPERYYTLAGRPVMSIRTPDGGMGVMELHPASGAFVPTYALYGRLREGAVDLDEVDRATFIGLVRACRGRAMAARCARPIAWRRTGDGEFPYAADDEGEALVIRVNDYPAEPLHSVMVGDQAVGDLEDWPPAWTKA